jgi:hypothetical protein
MMLCSTGQILQQWFAAEMQTWVAPIEMEWKILFGMEGNI